MAMRGVSARARIAVGAGALGDPKVSIANHETRAVRIAVGDGALGAAGSNRHRSPGAPALPRWTGCHGSGLDNRSPRPRPA